MAKNADIFEFAIPNRGQHVASMTQYGMAYPDGTILWGKEQGEAFKHTFEDLALTPDQPVWMSNGQKGTISEDWEKVLSQRAAAVRMDAESYSESHEPVTRQVVLAVTAELFS